MLELSEIRDYLKTANIADNYYVGKLNSKKEKSFGVYQLVRYNDYIRAVGIKENDHIKKKAVSILVHWNKNYTETEIAANQLFEFLKELNNSEKTHIIGEHEVCCALFINNEPIDVSTDDFGIYERVIEFELYYKE